VKVLFVDGNCIGDIEHDINKFIQTVSIEVVDIKYQMLTDPACDNQLYVTAMIMYKEL
jgi:hypothetical protein